MRFVLRSMAREGVCTWSLEFCKGKVEAEIEQAPIHIYKMMNKRIYKIYNWDYDGL